MKKSFFFLMIFIIPSVIYSQYSRGKVTEGKTINSAILGKDVKYTVYLPFDYDSSERYYPVVYLLHGYTDNDMGWIQFGEANMICDKVIAENEIAPMILIMPDAGVSWYINNYDGTVNYEDFFIKEFIPFIESEYRIRKEKRYRAVAGLSMGGYGTLIYSLKYPELFSAAAAFSAAVYTDEDVLNFDEGRWERIESLLFGPGLKGKERLTGQYYENNIIHIIQNSDIDKLKSVRYYIDCGDDDGLLSGNMELHKLLKEKEIYHEFRVRDGGHQWSYWRSGLVDALKFISAGFHQP